MQPADAETLLFENALQESKDQIYRSPGKGREETVMCFFKWFFSKEQEVIYKQYKFSNTNGLTHSNQMKIYEVFYWFLIVGVGVCFEGITFGSSFIKDTFGTRMNRESIHLLG